ncbi:MAG TPA: hypothetical protein VKX16_07380 [Chloroflexota bacterium]|nr:hypothetical protein [Chloroflexota bacterium]
MTDLILVICALVALGVIFTLLLATMPHGGNGEAMSSTDSQRKEEEADLNVMSK